jgi:hypothetical protein
MLTMSNRARSQPTFGAPQILAGGAEQSLALLGVDGAVGLAEIDGGPGLDFDEYEGVALPGDDVDFPGAAGSAIVPRHHDAAATAEIAMREVFPAAAVVVTESPGADRVGEAVDQADHWLSNY